MHKARRERVITGRGPVGKTAVHGGPQRTTEAGPSRCGALIGAETSAKLLHDVRSHVRYGAAVYTDEAKAYGDLCLTHRHGSVDHSQAVR